MPHLFSDLTPHPVREFGQPAFEELFVVPEDPQAAPRGVYGLCEVSSKVQAALKGHQLRQELQLMGEQRL